MANFVDTGMRAIVHRVLKRQGSGLLKRFDFSTIRAVSINEMRMFRSGISENQIKTIRVLNKPELIRFFTALEDRG